MICACHDPGVFGHQWPCPEACPKPSRVLVDKGTGQGFVVVSAIQGRQRL